MNELNLSQAELSRLSKISEAQISRIISGGRNPGIEFCEAISRPLRVPTELILRKAGLLPPEPQEEPTLEEINYKLSMLSPEKQQMIIDLVDSLIAKQDQEARAALHGKATRQQS